MGEKIPKISVIMPVYKGDDYLSEAVKSILNQKFSDFELIIICDDPTDKTYNLLDKYQQNDSRIKICYQERQGLVNSLNKGISLSKGEYIARMDADDISLPQRLEKQVEFMDENPEIGISGTWVKTIGDEPVHIWRYPCDHNTIISKMLFICSIAHPSVIIRKNIFCQNGLSYSQDDSYTEDYGLWIRAAKVLRFANIPEILLCYRLHASNTSINVQKDLSTKLRLLQIRQLGINPTELELKTHETLSDLRFEPGKDFIFSAREWLEKLQCANLQMKTYPEPAFSNTLATFWYYVCCNSGYSGASSWNLFNSSKLSKSLNLLYTQKAVLLLKPTINLISSFPFRKVLKY